MKYSYTYETLKKAVESNKSIAGVIREIGLVPAGGNYETVRRYIDRSGLNTEHFTGQGWSSGRTIGPKRAINDYLLGGIRISPLHLKERLISDGIKDRRCEMCGMADWLNEPIPLELDHINGNRADNSLINLRILCPNCHAKTPTYRGRNIKHAYKNRPHTGVFKRRKHPKLCQACYTPVHRKSKVCKKCLKRPCKIEWPDMQILLNAKQDRKILALARQLGVSDNAIRHRIRIHHIETPQHIETLNTLLYAY